MDEENFLSLVDNGHIKHIIFHGPITKTNVSNIITNLINIVGDWKKTLHENGIGFGDKLSEEDIENSKPKIILHLASPGGLVHSAFMLADTIENLPIEVDCILDGNIASASVIVLLACKNRAMQNHANIFLHETIHSCEQMFYSEIDTFLKEQKDIYMRVLNYYVEKTNLSQKEAKRLMNDSVIINKSEAKEYGFINCNVTDLEF